MPVTRIINEKREGLFKAYIGWNQSWWSYYNSYKFLVDHFVKEIELGNISIDAVSVPLLFSLRHSIELGLKANILSLQNINPEINRLDFRKKGSHSIAFMYNLYCKHL